MPAVYEPDKSSFTTQTVFVWKSKVSYVPHARQDLLVCFILRPGGLLVGLWVIFP